jgi:hypothetical protein
MCLCMVHAEVDSPRSGVLRGIGTLSERDEALMRRIEEEPLTDAMDRLSEMTLKVRRRDEASFESRL